MTTVIEMVSHPSFLWPAKGDQPAARHIAMHETGRLLCITRGNVLHAAADRLSQEGYSLSSQMLIRDAYALAPDITGTIQDSLALA
jgi:hypothetical protein